MANDGPIEDEFADWLPLNEAVVRVRAVQGSDVYRSVLRRLVDGLLKSYAEGCVVDDDGEDQGLTIVSQAAWRALLESDTPFLDHVWMSSDLDVSIYEEGFGTTAYRFYGIRIEPTGVWKMLPRNLRPPGKVTGVTLTTGPDPVPTPQPIPATITPVAQSRAGRPAQAFWENMIVAALKAIWYEASFQPKTQADVQRWMADWAIKNGHGHPGGTALKERARKVFLAVQE